ncbi:MAG: methionyl-tRNA formyltransferase, partial [Candidatus Zixiibacteriota bacterium]
DIFVVVAFRILPERIFAIPPYGSINLHGSLLPKYRGAAPIQWALINGEQETGLTTFSLKKKIDAGDIIYQEKIAIDPEETYDDLAERMSGAAGRVIEKTLDLIESGDIAPVAQDDSLAMPAPKINPADCRIDWSRDHLALVNFIRGLSSIPGAFTTFRGKKLKILRARRLMPAPDCDLEPGSILPDSRRLLIAGRGGAIEVLELIPEGKKKMTGDAFLRGYRPKESEILGDEPKGD